MFFKFYILIFLSIFSLAFAEEDFVNNDIKVRCNCEKDENGWKVEKISPEAAKKIFEEADGALGETRTLMSR